MSRYIYAITVSAMTIWSCKKPYAPAILSADNNFLVVEGIINTGTDSTRITLSRTVRLSDKATSAPENNALVIIESDQNASYPLKAVTAGKYVGSPLNASNSYKYRIHIKTADNREYVSEYVESKVSPLIDTIGFNITNSNVNIFSNAHDPSGNTRYYRWEYSETYIYMVPNVSYSEYKYFADIRRDTIVYRPPADQIQECWVTNNSSDIVLNSTAKLQQDIINLNPVLTIPLTSEKIRIRYSILLKQYALTSAAYSYYQNLKKNTEQLGGIFDAQPSELPSNIHCLSDPSEPVLGCISAGTISIKRIFIDNNQLPFINIPNDCGRVGLSYYKKQGIPDVIKFSTVIPISVPTKLYDPKKKDTIFSLFVGSGECTDCTLKGINKKPAFWK